MGFPNSQANPASAVPVYVVGGSSIPLGLVPKEYVSISGLSSVQTIGTVPAGATLAIVTPVGGSVNYRGDGPDPTGAADGGMPLYATAQIVLTGNQMTAFKFIQKTGDTATLSVTFY